MSLVAETIRRLLVKEAEVLRSFVTEPKGLFETADRLVVEARSELKRLREAIMGTAPRILRR